MTVALRFGRWLAAGALLLAASGCMTVEGQLEVADDTVSGAFVVAMDRAALAASGTSESEFLNRLEQWNPVQQLPAGGHADVQPYIADHLLGKRYVYDRVPLSDFGSGGTWRIQHVGDAYRVVGDVDFSGLAEYPGVDVAKANEGWSVTLSITFPGAIRSANGEVSGRTVSWQPALAKRTELQAEAADGTSRFALSRIGLSNSTLTGPGRWILVAGVTGECALVGGSAFLLWRRRRRRQLAGRHVALAEVPAYDWRSAAAPAGRGRHRAS